MFFFLLINHKPQFVPLSECCRVSPLQSAEKLAERTTGWPVPDFKHSVSEKRRPAGAMSSESGQDREESDWEDNLLRAGLTAAKVYYWICQILQQELIALSSFLMRQTAVTHSSRTSKAAVRGDPVCRFAAGV